MRSHKLVYGLAAMTLVGTLGLAACGSSETTTTATAGADGATAATDTEGDGEAAFTEYPIGEDQVDHAYLLHGWCCFKLRLCHCERFCCVYQAKSLPRSIKPATGTR